jgi:hypothetical protein
MAGEKPAYDQGDAATTGRSYDLAPALRCGSQRVDGNSIVTVVD